MFDFDEYLDDFYTADNCGGYACQYVRETALFDAIEEYQQSNEWN